MIPSGSGISVAGQRMAHHRQALQRDAGLARPAQHLVLRRRRAGSAAMFTPADSPLMPTSNPDRASTSVSRRRAVAHPHPADVAGRSCPLLMKSAMVSCDDRVDVELLSARGGEHRVDQVVGHHHPAQPQRLGQALAGRSQVDDPVRAQRLQRADGLAVVAELAVVVVVEDVTAGALRPVDDGGAPRRMQRTCPSGCGGRVSAAPQATPARRGRRPPRRARRRRSAPSARPSPRSRRGR